MNAPRHSGQGRSRPGAKALSIFGALDLQCDLDHSAVLATVIYLLNRVRGCVAGFAVLWGNGGAGKMAQVYSRVLHQTEAEFFRTPATISWRWARHGACGV